MTRARRRLDVGRLAKAVSRPGADPRTWVTLAVVDEVGFDAAEGIFVDVTFQPTGEQETCMLGAIYAGDGFGFYTPVEVGDIVVVTVPGGDPNSGPVVTQRIWRAADKPSADFGSGDEPSKDVWLRIRDGRALNIRTSGAGAVSIQAEGSGPITIKSAQGLLNLQDATEAMTKGESLVSALKNLSTALKAYAAGVALGSGFVTVANATTAKTALDTALLAVDAAYQAALSTRIKGA